MLEFESGYGDRIGIFPNGLLIYQDEAQQYQRTWIPWGVLYNIHFGEHPPHVTFFAQNGQLVKIFIKINRLEPLPNFLQQVQLQMDNYHEDAVLINGIKPLQIRLRDIRGVQSLGGPRLLLCSH